MQRREIRYTGRVQGVGFRVTVRAIAARHEVTGWVRNEPDGAVRMQVQGENGEIDIFLTQIDRALARNIENTESYDAPMMPEEAIFEIR